jgi:hypothetical protein
MAHYLLSTNEVCFLKLGLLVRGFIVDSDDWQAETFWTFVLSAHVAVHWSCSQLQNIILNLNHIVFL